MYEIKRQVHFVVKKSILNIQIKDKNLKVFKYSNFNLDCGLLCVSAFVTKTGEYEK